MHPLVAIDVARLMVAPLSNTPRGLDRVEFLYAEHFVKYWKGDVVGLIHLPWGQRQLSRDQCRRILRHVADIWREQETADPEAIAELLEGHFGGALQPVWEAHTFARGIREVIRGFAMGHFGLARPSAPQLPKNSVYLSVGHVAPAHDRMISWLGGRKDIKVAFMLHDLIPLEYSELVTPGEIHRHRRMMMNIARYADGIIVTTELVGNSATKYLAQLGRHEVPLLSLPLPITEEFLGAKLEHPRLRRLNYFIACGAFDLRKNYLFLLNVWTEIVRKHGSNAPKLLIVGRVSKYAKELSYIKRSQSLRGFVAGISGLSTPAVRCLMQSARGLLMPSLAEGFGLPIIEGLAMGLPVVASDLASHRQAGELFAKYVSPIDGYGWIREIEAVAFNSHSIIDVDQRAFQPMKQERYMRSVEEFLDSL